MRFWLVVLLVLFMTIGLIAIVGCGSSGAGDPSDTGGGNMEGDDSTQVTLPSTEATACAANRRIISTAAKSYQAVEGKAPSSIQQLVPEYLQSVPTCPAGGRYTLSGTTVTCSVHGS
jgi:hypothetical protein